MARFLALTVAVTALLFLFTFAHARAPLDPPENDVTSRDDRLVDLPESDPKVTSTILLPSEKPESDTATVAELESEETESKLPKKEIGTSESVQEKSETETVETVPLTVITFRPINRHFPRRPLIPFRRGHRCRGRHHHNLFKPWGSPRFSGPQKVSFGNDMILSGGEDLDFDPVSRDGHRQIPERWAMFNHGGNRFSFVNDASRKEEMIKRHDHDHEDGGEKREHEHEGRPRQMPGKWARFNNGGNRFSFISEESRREEMIKRPHDHRHDHDHDHDHEHEHEEEGEEREHEHEGGPRQVPERWGRFNHGGNRFSFINEESRKEEMIQRPHHHHHHHHHHHGHEDEEGEEREHGHESGFMKGIREFLNHF